MNLRPRATQWIPAALVLALIGYGVRERLSPRRAQQSLVLAVDDDDPDAARQVLSLGARADLPDDDGYTPLTTAAREGRVTVLVTLLDSGVAVDTPDGMGRTALLCAARQGRAEAVQLLLGRGAKPAHPDPAGTTPLMMAVASGRTEVVELLLRQRVDVNAVRRDGHTALMSALERLRGGVRSQSRPQWERELRTIDYLLRAGARVNARRADGMTPFLLAARGGAAPVLRTLADRGADRGTRTRAGESALLLAAGSAEPESVQALLELGASPDEAAGDGRTPLHVACATGQEPSAWLLCRAGARIDARTRAGETPLMLAAAHGDPNMTRPPRVAARPLPGFPAGVPLSRGAQSTPPAPDSGPRYDRTIALLLARGADLHACDLQGRSALMLAARCGDAVAVRRLLDHGAVPGAADHAGHDAAFYAQASGSLECLNAIRLH